MQSHPFMDLLESRQPSGLGGRWHGVYTALVSDLRDPDGQGRVKITLPWSPDATSSDRYEVWARMATLFAGSGRGSWFIPDVDDEVLVAFEAGDPRRPYVLGGLWNGSDSPPESMDGAGRNERKSLRSRNGVQIMLEDKDGQEQLVLETPGGQRLTLHDGPGTIELQDSNGNSLKLEPSGITIITAGNLTIQASAVNVTSGSVSVTAGMSQFSGVVQSQTVITSSVVSASYTPGAGNIL
jgi:uncharacterized protein involved in type VI secretion and phage assembly